MTSALNQQRQNMQYLIFGVINESGICFIQYINMILKQIILIISFYYSEIILIFGLSIQQQNSAKNWLINMRLIIDRRAIFVQQCFQCQSKPYNFSSVILLKFQNDFEFIKQQSFSSGSVITLNHSLIIDYQILELLFRGKNDQNLLFQLKA
ncbi:hypothetical protein pb186bvf_019062 [Paramecium bursaria]